MRKKILLVLGILLGIALAFLIYFWKNPTRFLELFNFRNPPSEEPQGLIPAEPLELVEQEIVVNGTPRTLKIPPGYKIEVFADGFENPRFMAIDPDNGDLYLTELNNGKVWNVSQHQLLDQDLGHPHGITFFQGDLYVSNITSVFRFHNGQKETLIDDLPGNPGHNSSTVAFGPDGKLYVSRGSSCNACENEVRRAAILRFDADGKNEEIFATGLRNSVGLVFHPQTGELWATENGRDLLGDDLPPEEINIIKEGKDYGWPYCYSRNVPDPDFGTTEICNAKEPPYIEMQAHSAPLGLRFDEGAKNLYVAFHGSWNRSVPTGYKIVRIADPTGSPKIADYITGWRPEGQSAWGRPVDVIFDRAEAMYISDDVAGVIYRLFPD